MAHTKEGKAYAAAEQKNDLLNGAYLHLTDALRCVRLLGEGKGDTEFKKEMQSIRELIILAMSKISEW